LRDKTDVGRSGDFVGFVSKEKTSPQQKKQRMLRGGPGRQLGADLEKRGGSWGMNR